MGKKRLRSVFRTTVAAVICISLLFPAVPLWAASGDMEQNAAGTQDSVTSKTLGQYDSIPGLSGEILYDTEGREVTANGGEIHQVTESGKTKWYWFGEDMDNSSTPGQDSAVRGIHLYSSTDLYNWTREEDMFKGMTSKTQFDTDDYFRNLYGNLSDSKKDIVFECLRDCPTAHPRVLYNDKNHQYVMWVPFYTNGKQCIATSSSIKGPFKFEKYCESIGGGFTEVYKESDGTAYILHQSGTDLLLSKLTDDYMDVAGAAQTVNFSDGTLSDRADMLSSEVGMFKRNGKYYMVHAAEKKYAESDSLSGTWSVHALQLYNDEKQSFEDIPDDLNLSPTHQILQVNTENGVIYINIAENWITQSDMSAQSRYVWLPIKFSEDGSTIALRKLSNWKLDVGDIEPEGPEEPGESEEPEEPGGYGSIPGLSGEILYDTAGQKVMANGGEIHQAREDGETKWYWFGETISNDSNPGESSTVQGIHLYSSTDLYNWTREEDMFRGMTSKDQFDTDDYFKNLYGSLNDSDKDTVFECLQNCPTAHPRVLYNEKNHQYVMWVPFLNGKQCIATSSSIKGPFKFVKYCESVQGFTGMYKESDGKAYIVYRSGNGISMSKLTDDYMDVAGTARTVNFSNGTLNSPEVGMFKRGGKYYMVHAAEKQYAVADSLTGTWSVHALQMYNNENQSVEDLTVDLNPTHQILQVNTENGVVYINITDCWNPQSDMSTKSCYVWLPLKFSQDGTIALRKLSNWKLDDIEPEEPEESEEPEEPGSYGSIPGLSGEILYDTEGQEIKANGGEIHQVTEDGVTKWYWFGEDMSTPSTWDDSAARGIHLYSSTDLYNWTREEDMLQDCPTAHPRVLYNEKNRQYVMWVPTYDGKQYIATSSSIKGPFQFEKYCASIGGGFTEVYKESDGTAYILHQNQSGTDLLLSKLTDDYMDVAGAAQTINFSAGTLSDRVDMLSSEVGMFKRNGKYYMVHAGVKKYAVADSLDGIWSVHTLQLYNDEGQTFEDVPDSWSPTHQVLQVSTESGVIYINITENWITQSDVSYPSRYVWLPIKFSEDGTLALRKLSNWKLEDIEPEETEEPPVVTPPVEVTEVRLTKTNKVMKVGEKYQIEATVVPANATNKDLSYSSSDDSVASVTDAGKVEAKKAGNATVTVTSANGKTAELKVTVEAEENLPVEVTEVRLTETSKTLKVGEKYQIEATVVPGYADNKTLSYESSDKSVASVSDTGEVEAKKAGNATVTVTSANGKKAELKVTVEAEENLPVEVTEVRLTETSKTLKVGEKYQIEATVVPGNADNKTLSYESSDKSVASVSDTGEVEAKKAGNATVTVKSANGKKAELKVTVTAASKKKIDVKKVLVSTDKMTIGVGEKVQLEAAVYPKNASDKKLTYKPSNNKVEVNKNGKITAQKTGSCKITITSSNNKKAVVKVTVKKKPGKISLNSKKKTLKVGKKFQIKPKLPNGTASYKITYTSSKKSVAAVSQNGKVTAKKKGDAVITVKTYNGKKASLKIHVK